MRYLPPAAALRGGAEVRRVLQAAAPTISGMSERRESVGMGERGGKKKKGNKMQMGSWEDRQREHLDGSH